MNSLSSAWIMSLAAAMDGTPIPDKLLLCGQMAQHLMTSHISLKNFTELILYH